MVRKNVPKRTIPKGLPSRCLNDSFDINFPSETQTIPRASPRWAACARVKPARRTQSQPMDFSMAQKRTSSFLILRPTGFRFLRNQNAKIRVISMMLSGELPPANRLMPVCLRLGLFGYAVKYQIRKTLSSIFRRACEKTYCRQRSGIQPHLYTRMGRIITQFQKRVY